MVSFGKVHFDETKKTPSPWPYERSGSWKKKEELGLEKSSERS